MLVASVLSLLLPGAGQLYVGARRRGVILLGVTVLGALGFVVFAATVGVDGLWGIDRKLVVALLAFDLAVLAFRLFAVADVWRGGVVGLAVLGALTAAPHLAAGYLTVRSYKVLENVFADEEPCGTACDRGSVLVAHVLAPLPQWVPKDAWEWSLVERLGPGEVAPLEADARVLADESSVKTKPWTTILLLGTDEGPGNWGARTDTIILAAMQHGTGRAAAFGVPAQPRPGAAGRGRRAVQGAAERALRTLRRRSGGRSALKQAVSNLLGIRVDYYAQSTCSASPISSTRSAASRSR